MFFCPELLWLIVYPIFLMAHKHFNGCDKSTLVAHVYFFVMFWRTYNLYVKIHLFSMGLLLVMLFIKCIFAWFSMLYNYTMCWTIKISYLLFQLVFVTPVAIVAICKTYVLMFGHGSNVNCLFKALYYLDAPNLVCRYVTKFLEVSSALPRFLGAETACGFFLSCEFLTYYE